MSFEVDSWVWMEDEEEKFLPAQVAKTSFKPGEDGIVKTEDGEVSPTRENPALLWCDPDPWCHRPTNSRVPTRRT